MWDSIALYIYAVYSTIPFFQNQPAIIKNSILVANGDSILSSF